MRTITFLSVIMLILLSQGSCRPIEQLPDEPEIRFTSFAVFDTTDILGNSFKGGRLKFYFEDGNGDMGMKNPEEGESDTTNLFFTMFRKTGSSMVQVPEDDALKPSGYRIPYMERTGRNKILRGTISITFLYQFYNTESTDTIKYDFYLKDRADNQSNSVSTPEIALSVNGLYVNP